jgi:hypothetical protein
MINILNEKHNKSVNNLEFDRETLLVNTQLIFYFNCDTLLVSQWLGV